MSFIAAIFSIILAAYPSVQEIKQAKSDLQSTVADHTVDVDCMMAEKCRTLVLGKV